MVPGHSSVGRVFPRVISRWPQEELAQTRSGFNQRNFFFFSFAVLCADHQTTSFEPEPSTVKQKPAKTRPGLFAMWFFFSFFFSPQCISWVQSWHRALPQPLCSHTALSQGSLALAAAPSQALAAPRETWELSRFCAPRAASASVGSKFRGITGDDGLAAPQRAQGGHCPWLSAHAGSVQSKPGGSRCWWQQWPCCDTALAESHSFQWRGACAGKFSRSQNREQLYCCILQTKTSREFLKRLPSPQSCLVMPGVCACETARGGRLEDFAKIKDLC